jgi:PAS domain-containing protein
MAAQQQMLASVIEAVPDPILVVDAGLGVVRANAAARRSFGVEPGRAGCRWPGCCATRACSRR